MQKTKLRYCMLKLMTAVLLLALFATTMAQRSSRRNSPGSLPSGYWTLEKSQPIVDKTETIRLAPDLSQLSEGERKAVEKLLEVGKIFQRLYEEQRHSEAQSSYVALEQ